MGAQFSIDYRDYDRLIDAISAAPGRAEESINNFLHGEGTNLLADSVTSYIPVSTGRYAAHKNIKKLYKHQKTLQHARNARWYEVINNNLAITITNTRNYYYLYFVENGLGTSRRSGGVDFIGSGIENVYDRLVNGMIDSITKEVI